MVGEIVGVFPDIQRQHGNTAAFVVNDIHQRVILIRRGHHLEFLLLHDEPREPRAEPSDTGIGHGFAKFVGAAEFALHRRPERTGGVAAAVGRH